jgi:hypothetical protein
MRKLGLALGLCFVSIMMMLACSGQSDRSNESDELKRASDLIDQKQYSEAIYILTDRLKRAPQEVRARVLLASAYAARAGLKMQTYTDFAGELQKWNKIDDLIPLAAYSEPSVFDEVARVAFRIEIVIRAFYSIPVPTSAPAIEDLNQGFQILTEGGVLSGGPSFYRALLHISVFKQKMMTTYRPKYIVGCQLATDDLLTWIALVQGDLNGIIEDVSKGMNDLNAQKSVKRMSTDVDESVNFLNRALTVVSYTTKNSQQLKLALNADNRLVPATLQIPPALKKVYGPCN